MSFATQTNAKVMIGPAGSLPTADGIPNGYWYHASDDVTKTWVLVIDPTTGVHRWDLVGPSPGKTVLKFAALVNAANINSNATAFIADDPDNGVSATAISYPMPGAFTWTQGYLNLKANSLNIACSLLIQKNGVTVVTVPITAGQTGILHIILPSNSFSNSAGDTIDWALTSSASGSGSLLLSGTMST